MVTALEQQGGEVVTGHEVTDLREFDGVPAVLLDTTPEAFVAMAGDRVNEGYRRWVSPLPPRRRRLQDRLDPVRAGALDQPRRPPGRHRSTSPAPSTRRSRGSAAPNQGRLTDRPYVLAVQPTVPDPTRAPDGGHIFWAYVHVPHGSDVDMTEAIENQIERFAPGFRDTVVERYTKTAVADGAVEPQLPRRRHLQRPGHPAADAGPSGAALEHLQDAGAGHLPRLGRHPARARRCTARAATTPRGSPCARCSASGTVPPLRPADALTGEDAARRRR